MTTGADMNWTVLEIAEVGTMLATIALVIVTWWQITLLRAQFTTDFEDGLAQQYRNIMKRLPTKVLLGSTLEELGEDQRETCRDAIYQYLDLSNEEAFLHREGRVRRETWSKWKEGIIDNMKLPAFLEVWRDVLSKSENNFEFLRDLLL
jgi:hypothetical protein